MDEKKNTYARGCVELKQTYTRGCGWKKETYDRGGGWIKRDLWQRMIKKKAIPEAVEE
jgi:hypothetical protein